MTQYVINNFSLDIMGQIPIILYLTWDPAIYNLI